MYRCRELHKCKIQKIVIPPKVIDGIKILCIGTNPKYWEANPLLIFATKVDEQTGEIISNTKVAFFKGLHFYLIPSTISTITHCILRGSLPKYYNNGKDNGYDYSLEMLISTIQDLKTRFHIDPFKAIVQNFEYGVNVSINQPPKTIVRGLRAYQNDCFTLLRLDEVFTGKQLQRQEYQYKIYDKGIQLPKKQQNLLRVELAIKSTKKSKTYGIRVLADLVEVDKLNNVKPDLIKIWNEMIFYDSGMKWRLMNKKQKEKMLYYLDATNWLKFNRKQRFRAKALFTELINEFCASTSQSEILKKIILKIEVLEAKKGNALRNLFEGYEAEKRERFTHLDKGVKRGQNELEKPTPKNNKKSVKIKHPKCKNCSTDISHKKNGSIYCGKSCNNASQARKRRKARRQNTTIENNNLQSLIKTISVSKLRLTITYKQKNLTYSKHYLQDAVSLSGVEVKAIKSIYIKQPYNITLTSYRARKLIRTIAKLNNSTT
jgi:hypothetical protein